MTLIIITGLPGTGKTTLGRKISEKFKIPFISKDDFKDIIFDTIGFKDREWSKKVGMASYDILYHVAEENLKNNKPVIIETNFNPEFANKKIGKLKKKYNPKIIQIRCFAKSDILFERFKNRAESGERHPGHTDAENLDAFKIILAKEKIDPIDIEGEFIDIDMTDFEKVNHEEILNNIQYQIEK